MSRRLVARYKRNVNINNLSNGVIFGLNKMYSGFYSTSASNNSFSYLSSSTSTLSTCQQRLVRHITACVKRFHDRRHVSSTGTNKNSGGSVVSGGVSSYMHDYHLQVSISNGDFSNIIFGGGSSSSDGRMSGVTAAVPLVADRVSLPSVAGQVDLMSSLPPHIAAPYLDPSTCTHTLPLPSSSNARVFASHREYVKLLKRMEKVGMIAWTKTPAVVNGLFGVAKPDGSIRLVIDGRPANKVFIDPPHINLPTPDLLPKLVNSTHQIVYVAKSDLSDFFYRFMMPEWMRPYFALPPVAAVEVGQGSVADGIIYPCLTVLAMGWSHSVYLAQHAHEHLLNIKTPLLPVDRITSTSDSRLDRVRHMVYIDDLIIIGTDYHVVNDYQSRYLFAAEHSNLPAKMSKVISASCDGVDCLGVEVHGKHHIVAPRPDKLNKLCNDTIALIKGGIASGLQLSAIVGRWTWCMLIARPALSIFSSVYRYIQCAGRKDYRLWPSVCNELMTAVQIAPLIVASFNSPWLPFIMATDASEDGQGVVKCNVDEQIIVSAASTAGTHSLLKSSPPIDDSKLDEAEHDVTIVNRDWQTIVSAPWRYDNDDRIEVLEMRSVLTAVKHVLSRPSSVNSRLLILCDSQAVVGCLSKGRSSSYSLLRVVRSISSLMLAGGLRLVLRWIPTHLNPADSPSRFFY